jgi:hypothetical protein
MTLPNPNSDDELTRTVIEDTQHWLMQAVVGLNLCPFAKAVVVKQRVRYAVCLSTEPADVLQMLRHELAHLRDTDPETLDTTLIMAPFALPDFFDFNQFLDACDAVLLDLDLDGELQIADFHPHYHFAGVDADDISHHTNRAPYPTLHLLRESSIDQAVAAYPDAAMIFERNIAALEALGLEGWQRLGIQTRVAP